LARQRAAAAVAEASARITRVARSTVMFRLPVEKLDLEQKPRNIQADVGRERKQLPARDSAAANW
jgi:hypothetical protein